MEYESSIFHGLKVMAKVKVFVKASNVDTDADAGAILAPRTFVLTGYVISDKCYLSLFHYFNTFYTIYFSNVQTWI